MKFKLGFIILMMVSQVHAEEPLKALAPPPYGKEGNCIRSANELKIRKDSFPAFLQKDPPVMFVRDSFPVAALSFHVEDGKILGEAVYKILFGTKKDNGYVSKICYKDDELKIELELGTEQKPNTKEYSVKVIDDRTIEVKGLKFNQATPKEFAQVLNKLNGEEKSSSSDASSKSTKTSSPRAGKN